jgi:two-component system, cell cycle sensor histidine kinase and response regulator CckA
MTADKKNEPGNVVNAQRLESIATLAGGIAHDLNNVLTPILLAIEVLKSSPLGAEQRELISVIEQSARRGAGIVRQVLSFARGIEGHAEPMQIGNLIADMEKTIRDTFPKNIRLEITVVPDLWKIKGDLTQLHQVILNMAINSREAMPEGGELKLAAENTTVDQIHAATHGNVMPGNFVLVRIEDSGIGIAPETLGRIFEPFFTTKNSEKGKGLGLSTALAIIQGHGGFIRAYSASDTGSKFHIYLPALTAAESADKNPEQETLPRGRGQLILVIDDEAAVRNVTRQTLETFGYRVRTAADGAEAVAVFAELGEQVELVLTDMMMPVLDGLGTVQVIRKMNQHVPIIAASGLPSAERSTRLDNEGIKYFLSKPYPADLLLKTVKAALNDAHGSPKG